MHRVVFADGSITPTSTLTANPTTLLAGNIPLSGAVIFNATHLMSGAIAPVGFLSAGIGEAPCVMRIADYLRILGERLDDPDHVYYTRAQIVHAVNVAQRLFCFLTLCLERSATFSLTNGQHFYTISDQISDWLVPLRAVHTGGNRLRPDTFHNLDLRVSGWRSAAGNPTRYVVAGFGLLALDRSPSSGSHTLSLTYAAEPAALVADGDVPEIPGEQQTHLTDGAYWILRLQEGGSELQAAQPFLNRYLDAAQHYGEFVRAKAKAQQYDVLNFDLRSFDRSKFKIILERQRIPQIADHRAPVTGVPAKIPA